MGANGVYRKVPGWKSAQRHRADGDYIAGRQAGLLQNENKECPTRGTFVLSWKGTARPVPCRF
jgi:hypothetical protein